MAMSPPELARTIDEVVPPLLDGLPPEEARAVDVARRAGAWVRALETLFRSLRRHDLSVPAETHATLATVATALGMEVPVFPGASVRDRTDPPPVTLRESAQRLTLVRQRLADEWDRFSHEVHDMRDIFGDDPVGTVIASSHQSGLEIAEEAVFSIVDAFDGLSAQLAERADPEQPHRLSRAELTRELDEVVPPLLAGLPDDEVRAVEVHRAAGEQEETLVNLFIALAGYHVPVPARVYGRLGTLADAMGLELPLLPVISEVPQRVAAAVPPTADPAGRAADGGVRRFELMPDYHCFPLWELFDDDVPDNPDPAELPISVALQEALLDWADAYDATLDDGNPADSGFSSPQAASEFDDRGRDLWRRLAEELRGTAVVTYRSVTGPGTDTG